MKNMDRREFLKKMTATTLGASLLKTGIPLHSEARELDSMPIPKRRLGKTGFDATIVSLGGQSTIEQPNRLDDAKEIINHALDLGINYIDTAEAYGRGISETYIGEVMKDRRDEVFLATKIRESTDNGIENDRFERSCERLQTDFIDLYFLHAVNNMQDLNTALNRENGAILAFERLKEKGRIGNIGISSHSTEVLSAALENYDFDCIFLTINPAGMRMNQSAKETRAFLKKVHGKDVGVIAMKLTARNDLFNTGISMEQAINYSLSCGRNGNSFPIATANIGITRPEQLDENVRIAKQYRGYSEREMDQLEEFVNGS